MLKRRHFLLTLASLPLLLWAFGRRRPQPRRNTLVAFGSCLQQWNPQPVFRVIADADPDLFIFCGDNVYGDTEDMVAMQMAYNMLGISKDYIEFKQNVPIVATWDDHDYGADDVGTAYPKKRESKELFLNFFDEPADSPRRRRDGVYTSYTYGEAGKRLQVILLDLRWWKKVGGDLLGTEQWAWLEKELRMPADVRLLVSSSQFVVKGSQWEKWDDHPADKARFLKLVDELELNNLVILSGDMHYGEFSRELTPGGIELIDFTSSGLNRFDPAEGIPNANRFALYDTGENFGVVDIDWDARPLKITLELRGITGEPVLKHILNVKPGLNTVS